MSTLPIVFGAWSLLLLIATFVPLGALRRPLVAFLRWLALGMVATPAMAFALAGMSTRGWGQPAWFAALFAGALALGSLAALAARPSPDLPWLAPAILAALSWLLLVADVVTGGRLQFDAALGNSPTVAGRFTGFGNIAFAITTACALLVCAATVAGLRRAGGHPAWWAPALVAVVLFTTLVADGAPMFGADVGGVLAFGPAAFTSWWLLAGRRLTWRPVVAALVLGLGAVAGFGLWDRSRPEDDRTHLGRFLAGDEQSRQTVLRKASSAGVSVYHSSLVWILVATAGLAAAAWWGRRQAVVRAFPPRSIARTLAISAALLGALGAALNDSGVAVPAMMAFVLVPTAVLVLVHADRAPSGDGGP